MDVVVELRRLAQSSATGRLDIRAKQGSGWMALSDGRVVSVSLSTAHPALGMRLVSGGNLSVTSLGSALAMQQQHPEMRLGDVLVRMGLASRQDIEAVAWEQLCDDMLSLAEWTDIATNFTPLPPASVAPGGPSVEDLLAATHVRRQHLQKVVRDIGGADTVPELMQTSDHLPDGALRPVDWAVLCRIDGKRSLRQIGEQAGFTTVEAASILHGLISAGFARIPEAHLPAMEHKPAAWPQSTPAQPAPQLVVHDRFEDPAELLRELSELGGTDSSPRRHGAH